MSSKESNKQFTEYDKTKLYEEKVLPLINEMRKICVLNNLPIFFACATKNKDGKTEYAEEGILTGSAGIELYDDWFEKFLLVGKLDLVPVTKISQFNDKSFGDDELSYINDTHFDDEGELETE